MSAYTGQLAALGAAGLWACTALAIDQAARRIGSLTVNLIRLVVAFGFLCLAGWLSRGLPLPVDASRHAWTWLAVSGLVGFTFGDLCLYRAYLVIGPRLSSLMMSLVPPLTALIGWLVLGETLSGRALALAESLLAAGDTPEREALAAMALAELGRYPEAAARERRAIDAAAGAPPAALARLRANLALYEAGKPCRSPWKG